MFSSKLVGSAVMLACLPVASLAQDVSFSTGLATEINPGLLDCGSSARVSAVGEITAEDGTNWTVPAATNFGTAPFATDLYNQCNGVETTSLSAFDLTSVPVADAGGSEIFTMFVFGDNYFELYVNGTLVAVDPVPFTPFNSNVIRFAADRPVTLAIMGVDWEENLGLGSENGKGKKFSPGDAGLVARVLSEDGSVAAITDATWKAQTFYVSPLNGRDCLVMNGATRDSSACSTAGQNSDDGQSAAHWPLPDGWQTPDFDASAWPDAVVFSNDTVGVNNKPAFTNFTDVFDASDRDPEFIWSSNLVLDNLVLMRTTFE